MRKLLDSPWQTLSIPSALTPFFSLTLWIFYQLFLFPPLFRHAEVAGRNFLFLDRRFFHHDSQTIPYFAFFFLNFRSRQPQVKIVIFSFKFSSVPSCFPHYFFRLASRFVFWNSPWLNRDHVARGGEWAFTDKGKSSGRIRQHLCSREIKFARCLSGHHTFTGKFLVNFQPLPTNCGLLPTPNDILD